MLLKVVCRDALCRFLPTLKSVEATWKQPEVELPVVSIIVSSTIVLFDTEPEPWLSSPWNAFNPRLTDRKNVGCGVGLPLPPPKVALAPELVNVELPGARPPPA